MELEALRVFVLAVQRGSLTGAAEAVSRTQPAVSLQIQRLEQEAGDRLLVREARGVRPTPAGEVLYRRAQIILQEADDLMIELRGLGSLRAGNLRLGATDVMAIGLLPRLLQRFRLTYPGVKTTVEVQGSRALARRVVNGDLDLALVTLPTTESDLEAREVHRDRMRFVAAPDHRLVGRTVGLAELAAEPLIHHEGRSVTRQEVGDIFRRQGLAPRVVMEVSSPEAIKKLVSLGLGVAPLSQSQIATECREGSLRMLRVPDFRCWRRSGMVARRDALRRSVVKAFAALLPPVPSRGRARPPRA